MISVLFKNIFYLNIWKSDECVVEYCNGNLYLPVVLTVTSLRRILPPWMGNLKQKSVGLINKFFVIIIITKENYIFGNPYRLPSCVLSSYYHLWIAWGTLKTIESVNLHRDFGNIGLGCSEADLARRIVRGFLYILGTVRRGVFQHRWTPGNNGQ